MTSCDTGPDVSEWTSLEDVASEHGIDLDDLLESAQAALDIVKGIERDDYVLRADLSVDGGLRDGW